MDMKNADEPCGYPGCATPRAKHEFPHHTYRTKADQIKLKAQIINLEGSYVCNWFHEDDVGGYGDGRL